MAATLLALSLGLTSPVAAETAPGAPSPTAGEKTFDALVLRPLGFVEVVAGALCFAASTPLVAPTGQLTEVRGTFVDGPVDHTFERPLGDF